MKASIYWLLPDRARKLHAFIDGDRVSLCRFHHVDDCGRATTTSPQYCVRCKRRLPNQEEGS